MRGWGRLRQGALGMVCLALAGCAATPSPISQAIADPEAIPPTLVGETGVATATEEAPAPIGSPADTATAANAAGPSAASPASQTPAAQEALGPGEPAAVTVSTGAATEESRAVGQPDASQGAARTQEIARSAAQPTVRYLSADDSNSQASPVVAAMRIRGGRYVQPSAVRTYEFLNYYTFDYPPPESGDLAIHAEMAPGKEQGTYTLQVALRSRGRGPGDLPPLRLTLLLDVSGSMAGPSLDLAREYVLGLARRLRTQDRMAVVVFAATPRVVMESRAGGAETVRHLQERVLPALEPGGVTDLDTGLRMAYEQAGSQYSGQALNRVILLSDGGVNAGELSVQAIAEQAEDSDRQGIYLAGIGVGEGFNDTLMDRLTDVGRGAYLFVDGSEEIRRVLSDAGYVSTLDLALKDVRLKMVMPAGWSVAEFHGEQISAVASEVTPQYLSSGDQMIYHLEVLGPGTPQDAFTFEAEYRPLRGQKSAVAASPTVHQMLGGQNGIAKGDAVVAYAEMLKEIVSPLDANRERNLGAWEAAHAAVEAAARQRPDAELDRILGELADYRVILERGEQHPASRDQRDETPAAVLGIPARAVRGTRVTGPETRRAVAALDRLGVSRLLTPIEGYRYLAISSGPVGSPAPEGGGELSVRTFANPVPDFLGARRAPTERQRVYDLHQVMLTLRAPDDARSFSFDFNFFSAEYPDFVNQDFNDTFYAILRAQSTNGGRATNIAFDAAGASIEVDNNYFQKPFHPIPNAGTGFDHNGSTGWLRTSWPIQAGEVFTLTFSVHDEGDAVFDSLVLLDNFRFHAYAAVGATDPLN